MNGGETRRKDVIENSTKTDGFWLWWALWLVATFVFGVLASLITYAQDEVSKTIFIVVLFALFSFMLFSSYNSIIRSNSVRRDAFLVLTFLTTQVISINASGWFIHLMK